MKRHYLKNKRHFLDFFLHFLNVHLILNNLGKKYEYPSLVISKIIDSERGGYLNV